MHNFDKKILITGGSGFIGRNLINKLIETGYRDITATYWKATPSNIKNVKWIKVNLIEGISINFLKNIDTVYMLAAVSSGARDIIERPEIFVTNNVLINQNTIINAIESKVKNIIFPSCSVMYKSSQKIQDENDVELNEIYNKYIGGASMKLYIEGLCKFYAQISNTKFSVIRHTNTYGPHDKFDKERAHVFAATIIKTDNSPSFIEIWGNGEEGRDFIFVEDLTELMMNMPIIQKESFDLICAGSEKLVSITELAQEICDVRGINPIFKYNLSKPSLPVNIVLSHQKAFNKYSWKPNTTLFQGIKKTLEWRHAKTI